MTEPPRIHWFLPTSGDGHEVIGWVHSKVATGDPRAVGRAPDFDYLADVARAADRLGFESVLTPTGTWCEDAWITTAALAPLTRRLKFIVAFRPDTVSPTLAAQMAAAFQRVSGGRLLLNVVTGGDDEEQRRYGDWLDHDRRYARTDEFLGILRGAWSGTPYDFEGEHYRVAGATVGRAGFDGLVQTHRVGLIGTRLETKCCGDVGLIGTRLLACAGSIASAPTDVGLTAAVLSEPSQCLAR